MSQFAEPARTITRERVIPRQPTGVAYPESGPAEFPGEPDLWHVHVPGSDVAPCGRRYHQPRRPPSTVPVVVAQGGTLCLAPECFG